MTPGTTIYRVYVEAANHCAVLSVSVGDVPRLVMSARDRVEHARNLERDTEAQMRHRYRALASAKHMLALCEELQRVFPAILTDPAAAEANAQAVHRYDHGHYLALGRNRHA